MDTVNSPISGRVAYFKFIGRFGVLFRGRRITEWRRSLNFFPLVARLGWLDQSSSGLDVTKNEMKLYSGGCCKTYLKTKRNGGNDEQNKLNKVMSKQVYAGYNENLTILHVYS